MRPVLWLILPCRDEAEALPGTLETLRRELGRLERLGLIRPESRMLFVDDGSRDGTWEIIRAESGRDARVCGLKLSRSFGQSAATLAGIAWAQGRCDCIITLDADLQDGADALEAMLERYGAGCDVVYGVRRDRRTDKPWKRWTAGLFHRVMGLLAPGMPDGCSECRLLSARAAGALLDYGEAEPWLRGLIPLLGFSAGTVEFARKPRRAGQTKYGPGKLLRLARRGVVSRSNAPLAWIAPAGCVCLGLGALGDSGLVETGLVLLALGAQGAYLGAVLAQTRKRPRWIAEETVGNWRGETG